jgi:hypothetical protein
VSWKRIRKKVICRVEEKQKQMAEVEIISKNI